MEQQKWYQIDFYIGMYDIDELSEKYSFKESIDKVTDLIGNCTIVHGIGSYKHSIGIRMNMNTLKVTKFIDSAPKEFASKYAEKFKEIFSQECVITNVSECHNLRFN